MAGSLGTVGVVFVALSALLYQFVIRDVLTVAGVGRELQSLSDYPFDCKRVSDPDFGSCEDMWFDHGSRKLYLACSNLQARKKWLPAMGVFEHEGVVFTDRIVVVDVDKPIGDTYHHQILKLSKFGDAYHALAITGVNKPGSKVNQLYLTNIKPAQDPVTGAFPDQKTVGPNATIELFEHKIGSNELVHVTTYDNPMITTPNNIAITPEGSFFISNDHGFAKRGNIANTLSPLLHTGNIVHCFTDPILACKVVSDQHSFPNGVLLVPPPKPSSPTKPPQPTLLFVSSAGLTGYISIYTIDPHTKSLTFLQKVQIDMPHDNLTWDPATNSVIVAGIPKAMEKINAFYTDDHDHYNGGSNTFFRVYEEKNVVDGTRKWVAEKILEDHEGNVLPSATTAISVGKGKFWFSGVLSPFVAVCEAKRIAAA